MMLAACARLGMGGGDYQVVEYAGDTIDGFRVKQITSDGIILVEHDAR